MSAESEPVRPKMWTKEDLAGYLCVSPSWVYNRTKSKPAQGDAIPHLKMGRLLRFDREDPAFQAWLDRHRALTAAPANK